jgi:hypothetical protein
MLSQFHEVSQVNVNESVTPSVQKDSQFHIALGKSETV